MTAQFISPSAHAVLDYATAAIQAVAPRLLGLDRPTGRIHKAALIATTGYSLLTDYPGGVYKVLPMKAHLTLDGLAGIGFLTAAFVKRHNRAAGATLAGLGLLSLAAAVCTKAPERARRTTAKMGGKSDRGDSPMRRYARERAPQPVATSQRLPDFLQRQVVPTRTVEAARI